MFTYEFFKLSTTQPRKQVEEKDEKSLLYPFTYFPSLDWEEF